MADEAFRRACTDAQVRLQERHAKLCAEYNRLTQSLGGGSRMQARRQRLVQEMDRIEKALLRLTDAAE